MGLAVEGRGTDPCLATAGFQLGTGSDPSCMQQCKAGYNAVGKRTAVAQCQSDGTLVLKPAELICTGKCTHLAAKTPQPLSHPRPNIDLASDSNHQAEYDPGQLGW